MTAISQVNETANKPTMAKLALASFIGTTLEWYEFVLYNSMAALVFNKLFFPQFDPVVGTILAFSTYAIGYLSRPVGGLVFGRLGDKLGRRSVLIMTLGLMGITTLLMGLLPTYASIGIAAPLLLVSLRFLQGVALGGEWAGAVLLSAEHGTQKNRGLNGSWTQMGPSAGTLLAAGALAIATTTLSDEDFLSWGWRIPFIASVVLIFFGFWLRKSVDESPLFKKVADAGKSVEAPVREIFVHHWRSLCIAGFVRVGTDVTYALLAVFVLNYLTQTLNVSRSVGLTALLIGSAVHIFSTPFFAILSDRFGRRPIYLLGAVASAAWILVLFPLLDTKNPVLITIGIIGGLICHSAMYGPQASFVMEQFKTRVRYTGSSLAYTLAGVLGGGFAPLIFVSLQREFPGTLAIMIYFWCTLIITILALIAARETAGRALED